MEDKIAELLGRGYSQTVVASAVGCDDSYVSQLMAEELFRDKVAGLRLAHVHAAVALDDSVDSLESKALDRLHSLMPFITKPMDAVRVYQIANAAKRKSEVSTSGTESKAPIVQLTIPISVAVQFKLDSSKQVVEVNNKSLASLPSSALTRKLAERKSAIPLLSDATSAAQILRHLERLPASEIANVL